MDRPYHFKDHKNSIPVKLEPHQVHSVELALTKDDGFGLFLGPGSGKTYCALEIIGSLYKSKNYKKILIVAPAKVVSVWKEDIPKLNDYPSLDISYCSYSSLFKLATNPENYDIIIFDESHSCKNPTSRTTKSALKLSEKANYVLLLTGTPFGNVESDVISQMKLINDSIFPESYRKTCEIYFHISKQFHCPTRIIKKHKETFYNQFKDYCFFFEKDLEEDENISLHTEDIYIDTCPKYENISKWILEYKMMYNKDKSMYLIPNKAVARAKLLQMCQGFLKDEWGEYFDINTSKKETLQKLIQEINSKGTEKIIIFTRFKDDVTNVVEICNNLNKSYEVLDGSTRKDVSLIKQEFESGGFEILIANVKSGGTGLNLQASNTTIWYALPDSYIEYKQGIHRIYRKGQENDCTMYRLIMNKSIDTMIIKALEQKGDLKSIFNKQHPWRKL